MPSPVSPPPVSPPPSGPLPRVLPRYSLASTCLGHAVVLGSAAAFLPWRSGTLFAVTLGLLTLLHVATAVVALLNKPEWLLEVWRALSVASALAFLVMTWSVAAAAIYVAKLYLRLGPSVATGIAAVGVLLALLTVPMAIWGARYTWPQKLRSLQRLGTGAGVITGVFVLTLPLASNAAAGEPMRLVDARLTSQIGDDLEAYVQLAAAGRPRSVAGAEPAVCKKPIDPDRLTALLTFAAASGGARSVCVQANDPAALRRRLAKALERARPGSTVVVDLIRAIKPLSRRFPLLDTLEVRPGIDGVCEEGRCLPAWQLTLGDAFAENQPLPSIPEVSYGFSADVVRAQLGVAKDSTGRGIDGLLRIETETLSADAGGVHRLVRTRSTPPSLSAAGVEQVVRAAQRYIETAQEPDGTFRYSLDPVTGKEDRATLNLPRQAGTTYALCELGKGDSLTGTVQRALGAFEPTEHRFGDFSALNDGTGFGLGKSALPLLSLLRCRKLAGNAGDRLIGQLSRLMLKLQRDNGSFYPALDEKTLRGTGDHEQLYAAGQAVLAMVLLEQQLGELKGTAAEPLPSAAAVRGTLDRAMAFYGGPYWPRPLRDFFFFEEGWHCLAAKHALSSHRNDAYERLCIDYVASRKRFVTRSANTAEPNFVGGYGVSDLFPPRNTATAGLGEALNAAIAIRQKRGEDVSSDKLLLRDVVSFLQRAQWSEASCYACLKPQLVVGGFSQMLAAPDIRIDYVQHAMSAVGHGGRLLFGS